MSSGLEIELHKAMFPVWTEYVVIKFGDELAAPCSSIETAVECLQKHGIGLCARVIRFADDVVIWPLMPRERGIA